jgi:hypothetical protein
MDSDFSRLLIFTVECLHSYSLTGKRSTEAVKFKCLFPNWQPDHGIRRRVLLDVETEADRIRLILLNFTTLESPNRTWINLSYQKFY